MSKKTRYNIDVNSPEFKLKAEHFLDILPDATALRNWIKAYLDIDLPFDTIDPDSNSNPIDALWSVYDCIKHNKGDEIPGFIYLSAREAYKTLGASILEVILLIHFKTSIAHMAAIDKQSQKAVSYINNFFRKLQPYLDYHGWKKISDSKTKIQFVEPGGMEPYITVIICTAQGANCISGDSVIELEDGSTVRAVELRPGSKIKTWDYLTGKDVYVSTQSITMTKKHARKIKFSNGSSVIVSDDHLIFTQHGWVFAEQIDIGDRVKTSGLISTSFAVKEAGSPLFIPSMRHKQLTFNSRNEIRLTLDTGVWLQKDSKSELLFENNIEHTRKGRKILENIKSSLTVEVVEIELMGLQELVDLHIDTNQPNLRSFYANGIFMHNSEHVPIMFVDEIDVVRDPSAYEEAKLIPGIDRGIFPITVKLSTRKYAFGLMQSELDLAKTTGEQVKRWNVLDITERCLPERHLPEEPKQDVYVAKNLPFRVISEEQYEKEADPHKWEKVNAFKGCLSCDLLPVCKTKLAAKPEKAIKGLYRPIKATINSFKRVSPEMGEAQLLCFSPNTQILMADGTSKSIDKIHIGDFVITHQGNMKKVTKTFKRFYSGPVFDIPTQNWEGFDPSVVTPEHPYFVNGKEFKSIEHIKPFIVSNAGTFKGNGEYLSLPSKYQDNSISTLEYSSIVKEELVFEEDKVKLKHSITDKFIPSKIDLTPEFGWILGYFLAEGFYLKDSKKRHIGLTFCSDIREIEYHQKVEAFAKEMGLTTSKFKTKNNMGYTMSIYNSTLAALFKELCGEISDHKSINPLLINSNIIFLNAILEGFCAGGRAKRENKYRVLATTSYNLASQLFLIASRLSLCPRIKKKPKPSTGKQIYLVIYNNKSYQYEQKRARFKIENDFNLYCFNEPKFSQYKGYVYNIEVEDDHSYIANGVAVHNCWKPSTKGLVYGRFESNEGGNTISIVNAAKMIAGDNITNCTLEMFVELLKTYGYTFYAGLDWGFTHESAFVIFAKGALGPSFIVDCFAEPGLELADFIEKCVEYQKKYPISKWFCDQAQPSHIKTLSKALKAESPSTQCPQFTKDVMGGIEAIRSQIVTTKGIRKLLVLETEENKKVIQGFKVHHFKLDARGNPTTTPDDEEYADIMDCIRYVGQNIFSTGKGHKTFISVADGNAPAASQQVVKKAEEANKNIMLDKISELTGGSGGSKISGKKGKIVWGV